MMGRIIIALRKRTGGWPRKIDPAREEKTKGEGAQVREEKGQAGIYRYYERTWAHLEIYWPIWSRGDRLLHNRNTTINGIGVDWLPGCSSAERREYGGRGWCPINANKRRRSVFMSALRMRMVWVTCKNGHSTVKISISIIRAQLSNDCLILIDKRIALMTEMLRIAFYIA